MRIRPATQVEIGWIRNQLESATRRPKSGDFLDGFPKDAVRWFRADLEVGDFGNLFLFWDGVAWGEETSSQLRRLPQGVEDFRRLAADPSDKSLPHLVEIQKRVVEIQTGQFRSSEPYLVMAGEDANGRMIILDGNHRAAAAFWWAQETGDSRCLPRTALLGLGYHRV